MWAEVKDQREIKGCIQALVSMWQHTHPRTCTVKNRNQRENYDSGIIRQTYCSGFQTHMGTFHFSFAVKPWSEHSLTVLMREKIKQQIEGPLCSHFPPTLSLFLSGVERQHVGGGGGKYVENRDEGKPINK